MFPRLFTIDGVLTLHTYGLLVALGLLAGLSPAGRLAARAGLDKETVWNLGVYMALVALVGAKLAVVVTEWGYYSAHPREIFSWTTLQAGGIFYGGLAFAFILAVGSARRYRLGLFLRGGRSAPPPRHGAPLPRPRPPRAPPRPVPGPRPPRLEPRPHPGTRPCRTRPRRR